jgi:hypothetical protein
MPSVGGAPSGRDLHQGRCFAFSTALTQISTRFSQPDFEYRLRDKRGDRFRRGDHPQVIPVPAGHPPAEPLGLVGRAVKGEPSRRKAQATDFANRAGGAVSNQLRPGCGSVASTAAAAAMAYFG